MKIIRSIHITLGAALLAAAFAAGSCRKLIDIQNPVGDLVSSSVFSDSSTATSAVMGMYSQFYNGAGSGYSFYSYRASVLPSESADELKPVQNTLDYFYGNSLTPGVSDVADCWAHSYYVIYTANSIIDGVKASTLSASLKQQLTAEARFMRAFCHLYLVNYFGKVPLITSSDVNTTNQQPAADTAAVYSQIIDDLTAGRDGLGEGYNWSGGNRTRANKYAAAALLARACLYQGRWAEAEAAASMVIGQTGLYTLEQDLNKVFLANDGEAIWQCYTNAFGYTYFASHVVPSPLSTPLYEITPVLNNAFEAGDLRKQDWLGTISVGGSTYIYPYKYKSKTDNDAEYETVLRLAEQYLIRAEARAQQGNTSGAIADLDAIRHRAGLAGTTANDQASLLKAIAHERQVELFCEWSHRWFDLRRTGQIDAVLGAEKTSWQSTAAFYPIPQTAINTNHTLEQNPGYH